MKLRYECMVCRLKNEMRMIETIPDNRDRVDYLKGVMQILLDADPDCASPALTDAFDRLNAAYGFPRPDYTEVKKRYNDMLLGLLSELRRRVSAAGDPLAEALKICRAGNYIDFGAFRSIDDTRLMELIDRTQELNPAEYRLLLADLSTARTLTYVTDNCGEVVLDMLVLEQIAARFPRVQITALARGSQVINDATVEDLRYIGLDRYARLMGNGSALAGCQMALISREARQLLEESDIIIAKGMGNFETLCECGLNVYYLFLCKCEYFANRLGVTLMDGMMLNEQRMK